MKLPALIARVAALALLSLVVANTILPTQRAVEARRYHHVEVELTAAIAGQAQLFYNAGRNFNETDSARLPVPAGTPTLLRFRLDAEIIRGLRFDPIDNDGTVTLRQAVIRAPDGRVIHRFAPADFVARNQIADLRIDGDTVTLRPQAGGNDPFLDVLLGTGSIALPARNSLNLWPYLAPAIPVFGLGAALWIALALTFRRWGQAARDRLGRLSAWAGQHPGAALALAALAATVLSSYPVVFAGASYVSPNYGTVLLYDGFPTLPGYRDAQPVDTRGADVGAIMWQHVPQSFTQARAWFRDFEIPLWNRYNSGGVPMLGQGQMMVGDPLHAIVLLGGGAAWSWDLKYLVAKWLLGFGLGLLVWRMARDLPAALLVAAVSVFSGFFAFRANHPAFFSFCYGPWVLVAWCLLTQARTRRELALALGAMILASSTLLTSGTVKEAYLSLLLLHFAGLVLLLCAPLPWAERLRRTAWAAGAGVAFLLITSPAWLTLLTTIRSSYSSYNQAFAYQLQPSLLLGLFDEILLRPFWENERVFNPSTNFVILLGVLAVLVNLRGVMRDRAALGLGLAALLPLAFVFGFVPPQWIASWPFLGNIHHIDNSFGIPLIHVLTVLAGFGFASVRRRLGTADGKGDLALAGLILLGLVALYLGFTQAVHRSTYTYLHWGETVPRSDFVWGCFAALLAGAVGLALLVRRGLQRDGLGAAAGVTLAACALILLWRHGLHVRSAHPEYTLNAAPRVQLDAPSAALKALQGDAHGEAVRAVGLRNNLFSGWSGVYEIEGINGPDALMNPHVRELQEAFALERIWDWRLYLSPENLPVARPFLDLFNVRYLVALAGDRPLPGAGLTPLVQADLDLYRNETAWPRAFFTDRLGAYNHPADFAALVRQAGGHPLAAVQRSDRRAPSTAGADLTGRRIVPATAYRLTNNSTRFTVQAPGPGYVVLAEAWLDGNFVAQVNGEDAPYFRVNHAFKGIELRQAGTYEISFRYRPRLFPLSLGLAVAGLAMMAGAGFVLLRTSRPSSS